MKYEECPVCQHKDLIKVFSATDYLVSKKEFVIEQCSSCGLRLTYPRPDDDELGAYYDSEEYISHADEGNTLINKLYKLARTFTLRSKRKLIARYSQGKTLLDVGCGTAHFLQYCQQAGWAIDGVEPNDLAREQAEKNTGINIHQDLAQITGKTYDVITLWHVLEHLPDLHQTIRQLKTLLSTNGLLVIAVPNYEAYEAGIFKEYWAAYDVPRHLYHFNKNAMQVLMEKSGLKIAQIKPMWLDSFYISLLSNKQQSGRSKYLNSFITGLLSNIYALKATNTSSLIYLIRKS